MSLTDLRARPVREEMRAMGLRELVTPEQVDAAFAEPETLLVAVNSMCGCAAGIMRPAVRDALARGPAPGVATTVFAGQDTDATARAREYFAPHPPSSPAVAIVRGGETLWMLSRAEIEGRPYPVVAEKITRALTEYCG